MRSLLLRRQADSESETKEKLCCLASLRKEEASVGLGTTLHAASLVSLELS